MSAEHSDPQCPDPSDPNSSVPTSPFRSPSSRHLSRHKRLELLRRLTLRDRTLLGWLAEHLLLSTDQITQALFPSRRAALLRLSTVSDPELLAC